MRRIAAGKAERGEQDGGVASLLTSIKEA